MADANTNLLLKVSDILRISYPAELDELHEAAVSEYENVIARAKDFEAHAKAVGGTVIRAQPGDE